MISGCMDFSISSSIHEPSVDKNLSNKTYVDLALEA